MNKSLLGSAIVLALVVSVAGATPIMGTYESPAMLGGHWSESFIGGGGSMPGNEIAAASWDGTTLGGQWDLSGVTLVSDTVVSDVTIGGLQVIQYRTVYSGGALTLMEDVGMWTGTAGDGDYDVSITNFTQSTVVTLFNGQVLTVAGAISMQGTFDAWSDYSINYLAATTTVTDGGTAAPPEYPPLSIPDGQWGPANDVQLQIIPEPMTMSLLALGALVSVARRRRR